MLNMDSYFPINTNMSNDVQSAMIKKMIFAVIVEPMYFATELFMGR